MKISGMLLRKGDYVCVSNFNGAHRYYYVEDVDRDAVKVIKCQDESEAMNYALHAKIANFAGKHPPRRKNN